MVCGMTFDLEQDYFHWLCELIGVEQGEHSYWILAQELHRRPYYALIPHDENRAADGIEVRENYLQDIGWPKYAQITGECSMLEMLIGIAQSMEFQTDDPYDMDGNRHDTGYWFWDMMANLGLTKYDDEMYGEIGRDAFYEGVERVLSRLLERRYSPDGHGGLFPLNDCDKDQREVEIWYQMCAYLADQQYV